MTRRDIDAKLRAAVVDEPRIFFVKPIDAIAEPDRLREDVGLDSVGLLYLVLAVEDAFNLEVDDAEEVAEHFETWGELLSYIEERLN